jgi:hypothetical protein
MLRAPAPVVDDSVSTSDAAAWPAGEANALAERGQVIQVDLGDAVVTIAANRHRVAAEGVAPHPGSRFTSGTWTSR